MEVASAHCSDDEEDYRLEDLKQENVILRTELTSLYQQFLSPKYDAALVNNADSTCQTEFDVFGLLESAQGELRSCASELTHEKAHNAEQSKFAKEAERRIRDLERKLLDMNLELFKAAPLKDRVEELTTASEALHDKLSVATNEHLNLTVEVKYHKQKIAELNDQLEERQVECISQAQKLQASEVLVAALTKSVEQRELQLTAASALNSEYQAKLHKDDIQFLKLNGELNHWERKCESQSKEIQRLSECYKSLTTKYEAAQSQLALPACTTAENGASDSKPSTSTTRPQLPRAASTTNIKTHNTHTYVPEPVQRSNSYAYGSTYGTLSTFGSGCSGADSGADSPSQPSTHVPPTSTTTIKPYVRPSSNLKHTNTSVHNGNSADTGGTSVETGSADGFMDQESCVCNFPFFGLSPVKPKKPYKRV